jgi:hypothetical protein
MECIEEYLAKGVVLYCRIHSENQNERKNFVVSAQV